MSKKQFFIGSIILAVSLISLPALATDYSSMNTAELAALRGTMRDATDEDRATFRAEWQERVRTMTREEAQQYRGRPENALADGNGYQYNASNRHRGGKKMRNGSRVCDGTGKGRATRENRRGGNGNNGQ